MSVLYFHTLEFTTLEFCSPRNVLSDKYLTMLQVLGLGGTPTGDTNFHIWLLLLPQDVDKESCEYMALKQKLADFLPPHLLQEKTD